MIPSSAAIPGPVRAPVATPHAARAVRATVWTIVGFGTSLVLRSSNNIILSYFLVPEAFGVVALVNVFLQGLFMLSDVGVGHCIVQNERGNDPDFANTGWTIQVFRGFGILAMTCLLAFPLSSFYEQPQLFSLFIAAGFCTAIEGLMSTAVYSARRNMEIGRLTLLEFASQLCGIFAMCLWAWWYPSPWALIFGRAVHVVFQVGFSHLLLPSAFVNRFRWDSESAAVLFRFGKWVVVGMTIAFFATQMDRMILGKLMDMSMLGIYSIAITVAIIPTLTIERLGSTVLFPLFSEVHRSIPELIDQRVREVRGAVLLMAATLLLGVFCVSPLFFRTLFHTSYRDAAWIAQLLCIAMWFSVLSKSVDRALIAVGDTRCLAMASFVRLVATTAGSLIGYHLADLPGFCAGLAVAGLLGHVVLYPALRRHGVYCFQQDFVSTSLFFSVVACSWLVQQLGEWKMPGLGSIVVLVCPLFLGLFAVARTWPVLRALKAKWAA